MAPATGTAILILAAFLLPGFVALVYAERTYRTRAEDGGFDRLLITLYYSALTYAGLVAGFLLLGLDSGDVRELYKGMKSLESYAALALAALVLSLGIAEAARRWHRSSWRSRLLVRSGISAVHQTPSGWEHFFLTDRTAMVRVTLNDGRVIGGYFGPMSFAGYTAETPDLFLKERWVLDEDAWFTQSAPGTLGVSSAPTELSRSSSRSQSASRTRADATGKGARIEPHAFATHHGCQPRTQMGRYLAVAKRQRTAGNGSA